MSVYEKSILMPYEIWQYLAVMIYHSTYQPSHWLSESGFHTVSPSPVFIPTRSWYQNSCIIDNKIWGIMLTRRYLLILLMQVYGKHATCYTWMNQFHVHVPGILITIEVTFDVKSIRKSTHLALKLLTCFGTSALKAYWHVHHRHKVTSWLTLMPKWSEKGFSYRGLMGSTYISYLVIIKYILA
jgi:hypothetical protein